MTKLKERIENNLGLLIGGMLLTGFLSGFGAYKALLETTNQDVVPAGTYLSKDECRNHVSFGQSYEELAARLLDLLQPASEEDIIETTLKNRCAGEFVTPQAKVEVLAYLNAGEAALRHKAVLAYANCATGLNEAFLLARTIRADEDPMHSDAYGFGLWAIIFHHGDVHDLEMMQEYLLEINAPQTVLAAFLEVWRRRGARDIKGSLVHSWQGSAEIAPNHATPSNNWRRR